MAYSAKVVADSVSSAEKRLVTLVVVFPRIVLAEFNTHRVFSRNSASSRAIPVHKQLRKLLDEPFIPERFGRNQPGMQSSNWLEGQDHNQAVEAWLRARDRAATSAFEMLLSQSLASEIFGYKPGEGSASLEQLQAGFDDAIACFDKAQKVEDPTDMDILGIHKQLCNRVLEPFMWHTVVVTASEWGNFFALRAHEDAQAEIRKPAELMLQAMEASMPTQLDNGEWHTPFIQPDEDFDLGDRIKISCGRCARVSYLTHDGVRDPEKDIGLYSNLVASGHMSPTEHAARPLEDGEAQKGNFVGWQQHRADLPHEENFGLIKR